MPKIIFLIPRNPQLSVTQFRTYYEDNHVPLALKFIGPFVSDYRRNYPLATRAVATDVQAKGSSHPTVPNYDCVTEMWFDSEAAMHEMYAVLASPEVSAVITEDEALFIDRQKVVAIVVDERRVDLALLPPNSANFMVSRAATDV